MNSRISTSDHISKDLLLILVLAMVIFAAVGVAWYFDARSGFFSDWAAAFYRFIMRR